MDLDARQQMELWGISRPKSIDPLCCSSIRCGARRQDDEDYATKSAGERSQNVDLASESAGNCDGARRGGVSPGRMTSWSVAVTRTFRRAEPLVSTMAHCAAPSSRLSDPDTLSTHFLFRNPSPIMSMVYGR